MATIYVKARPGRAAFYEGRKISTDEFVPVADTPYVRRLINHWGDVEVQRDTKKPAPKPPPAPSTNN